MNAKTEKDALAELDAAYKERATDPEAGRPIYILPELRLDAAYLLLRERLDEALELIADLRLDLSDVRQSVRWLESDQ